MTVINEFSLTPAKVRAHMFPRWNEFSDVSSPTEDIVEEMITEQAGNLAAKLYAENIIASGITTPDTAAYQWCVRTLKLMVAVAVLNATTMSDPELTKAYRAELKARLEDLDEKGATALGDAALDAGDSPADGPTTHINTFGLTTDSAEDMSDTVPLLRKSDRL